MKRAWINDYGMAGVLLAVCVFFSAMTWSEQRPAGQAAARQIAPALAAQERIVIVTPKSNEGEVFAEELERQLGEKQKVVATIAGEPFEVREKLQTLLADSETFDTVAAHPAVYHWSLFDQLAESSPVFAKVKLVTAAPSRGSSFLRPSNLLNIANQIAVIAIIAIGMTMIIITGGIDLSVGSLVALSAVVTTWLIREYGGGVEASTAAMILGGVGAIAVCAAVGCGNGLIVTQFRVPPFIVTLGMMMIASGLAYRLSGSQSIDQVPPSFVWLGRGTQIPHVPNAVVLMLLLFGIAHLLMTRTVFGRYIYAVGGNAKAAWLSGVPVNRVLVAVYTLGGMLAGLGGVVLASQLHAGAPTYGQMYEMFVIAAVVVGGTSLSGGEGRIFGTLVGALIIAVIQNGMNLLGIESDLQRVVLGAMILGAVLLDRLRQGPAK
jgi:ribose transport system permease protein